MKYYKLEEDDRNSVHDSILDAYFLVKSKNPTETQIAEIFEDAPRQLELLAEEWGWSDTEVYEKLFRWAINKLEGKRL